MSVKSGKGRGANCIVSSICQVDPVCGFQPNVYHAYHLSPSL